MDFTKAEKILAFNNPLMQFCLYSVMIFVLYFGSYTIITSKGLTWMWDSFPRFLPIISRSSAA